MKYFVLSVICILGAVQASLITEDQKSKIMEFHKQCMDTIHADEALITKATKGEYVDDPALKRHLLCVTKKIGFQNESGDLQIDLIKARINDITKDEKLTNNFVTKCAINKDTPENTAFEALKCFHNLAPTKDVFN